MRTVKNSFNVEIGRKYSKVSYAESKACNVNNKLEKM